MFIQYMSIFQSPVGVSPTPVTTAVLVKKGARSTRVTARPAIGDTGAKVRLYIIQQLHKVRVRMDYFLKTEIRPPSLQFWE